ncbi:AsmA family protein [Bacteroidales bacterium OttesenSCG-928-K03]|nr:AsmA family protein [Bacteroidales bacterium OttesenSCG-928-L14]MDL2242828.1 AsmA family protein [Bacteroidales bacterium OttesenSCG-928-K03]
MKKALKITGITLLSIIGVLLIVVGIALWLVLTPKRITPIVHNQVEKFITAKTELGKIELTLFKTFPKVGLKIHDVCIINPIEGSHSDTVAYIESCVLSVNIKDLLKKDNAVLNVEHLYINNGYANIFTNCNNESNFDIIKPTDTTDNNSNSSKFKIEEFLLDKISINNLNVLFEDCPNNIFAEVANFSTGINLYAKNERIDGVAKFTTDNIYFKYHESDSSNIDAILNKLNLNIEGIKNNKIIEGIVHLDMPGAYFNMDGVNYLNSNSLSLNLPLYYDMEREYIDIKDLIIKFDEYIIALNGNAELNYNNTEDILLNADFNISKLIIEDIIPLIPEGLLSILDDIKISGAVKLDGSANGIYSENTMPKIKLNVLYENGNFSYSGLDYNFRDVYAKFNADVDISDNLKYDANIEKLNAKTLNSSFDVSGKVHDTTGNIFCNLKLNANLNLPDAKEIIPDDMNIEMTGRANLSANAKFKLDDLADMNLMKTNISGRLILSDLYVLYEDSIKLVSPKIDALFVIPNQAKNVSFKELVRADIVSSEIIADISDNIHADLKNVNLAIGVSNILDTKQPISVKGSFEMSNIIASMDTINANISNPIGTFSMTPSTENKDIMLYDIEYFSNELAANMGSTYKIGTSALNVKAKAKYDEKEENILLQWNPEFNFDITDVKIDASQINLPIEIPNLNMDYDSKVFNIHDGNFLIGNSSFNLKGEARNIEGYVKEHSLLEGVFDFTSDFTDVDQLMDLVNGFGVDSTKVIEEPKQNQDDNPFFVPCGVDIRLNTVINKAAVSGNNIESIGGHVTVRDGVLILEEMGLTTSAARMLLTAIYRPERTNHLFLGLDFHLLDINIGELIDMVPFVDTLVPMLKSFHGNAEFHFAAETYLRSNYEPKMSTLRGAASISGKDLILLDSETFSTIAKWLRFDKKTENVIDSLNVELTVFRDEVDLYPLVISMDKYQAVVDGRHNIDKDLTCKYHISITDTPLPIRLGLDISGPITNTKELKYKLAPVKYAHLYNPKKQNVVQTRTLELQKMIREALQDNVKNY